MRFFYGKDTKKRTGQGPFSCSGVSCVLPSHQACVAAAFRVAIQGVFGILWYHIVISSALAMSAAAAVAHMAHAFSLVLTRERDCNLRISGSSRRKRYAPTQDVPTPLRYMDVHRRTKTSLDEWQEQSSDDCKSIDVDHSARTPGRFQTEWTSEIVVKAGYVPRCFACLSLSQQSSLGQEGTRSAYSR